MQWPTILTSAKSRLGMIVGLTALAYSSSLFGGFLHLDDDWMVFDNEHFRARDFALMHRIWFDFSREFRLSMGAEYLPMRDSTVWLETYLMGMDPHLMRVGNLVLYLGAIALFCGAMRRAWGRHVWSDLSVLLFALHPVHCESVSWIVGRKDVLGLFFLGVALFHHAGTRRHKEFIVVPTLLLSQMSKLLFVVGPLLLIMQDLLQQRGFKDSRRLSTYGIAIALALSLLLIQWSVAHETQMTPVSFAGGSRLTATFTMGPVWWRYLQALFFPTNLSIVHHVALLEHLTLTAASGWLLALTATIIMLVSIKRHWSVVALALAWIILPLVLTSQTLVPTQTLMADRYLVLSTFGVGVVLAALGKTLTERGAQGWGVGWAGLWLVFFFSLTSQRAFLFGESVRVFADAVAKEPSSVTAAYQLGLAQQDNGQKQSAIHSLELAMRRAEHSYDAPEIHRRTINNLAILYAESDQVSLALSLLENGRQIFPDDPKLLTNLIKLHYREGHETEARTLHRELMLRFPDRARSLDDKP